MGYIYGTPIQLFLGVTYRCNLNCPHCYSKTKLKNTDLDIDTIKKIIDQCDKYSVLKIVLTYGENLLRKDFFEILAYIKKKDIHVTLITNGLIINKEIITQIKSQGINKLLFSLDSIDAQKHDTFRGKNGLYHKVVSAIGIAQEQGISCGIVMSLNDDNISEVEDMIALARTLNITDMNFLTTRRVCSINFDTFPSEDFKKAVQLIHDKKCSNLNLNFHDPLVIDLCNLSDSNAVSQNMCGAGKYYLSVAPDGAIYPCNFINIKLGSVYDTDLLEAFNRSKALFTIRRNNVNCKECSSFNTCEGGCATFSYLNNTFFERDSRCKK